MLTKKETPPSELYAVITPPKRTPPKRTPEQIRAEVYAHIKRGPTGYFWALQGTGATPQQLAIGKSADEEIAALRAIIRKLGGEV